MSNRWVVHTPDALRNKVEIKTNSAANIPLFHVVTFHGDLEEENVEFKRKKRQEEIACRVQEILDAGMFGNTCDTLCRNNEEQGFYLYIGHLFPLIDDTSETPLHLVDATCFLMVQMACFMDMAGKFKGSPFDTGGVVTGRSRLGQHVSDCLIPKQYNDEYDYVEKHSAIDYKSVLEYASAYIDIYFGTAKDYVDRMFQMSDKEHAISIDGLPISNKDEARNTVCEVRYFERFAVPTINDNRTKGVFVLVEEVEKSGNFPRQRWKNWHQQFDIQICKSPIMFAYQTIRKSLENL
jgi:hypothetical protein